MAYDPHASSLFADVPEEAARLALRHQLFHAALGDLVPEPLDLSMSQTILDLACGSGEWVLDMARAYPTMQVVGVDPRQRLLEVAQLQALAQGRANAPLSNVQFRIMDIIQPLHFESGSFDYVHGQSLSSFLSRASWSQLLSECQRLLRPGGVLDLIEAELAGTTSAAFEEFLSYIIQAFHAAGKSFTPSKSHVGIIPFLKRLFNEAGFQQIQQRASLINYSAGEKAHSGMYQEVLVAFKLLQPFLLDAGVTTLTRFGELYQQVLVEMRSDAFCGLLILVSTLGKKPTAST